MAPSYFNVIEFCRLLGLDDQDPIVIGKRFYREPRNTILDIPKFMGKRKTYFTPNPVRDRRLKTNVLRYVSCYSDLDFKDFDWAMLDESALRQEHRALGSQSLRERRKRSVGCRTAPSPN